MEVGSSMEWSFASWQLSSIRGVDMGFRGCQLSPIRGVDIRSRICELEAASCIICIQEAVKNNNAGDYFPHSCIGACFGPLAIDMHSRY